MTLTLVIKTIRFFILDETTIEMSSSGTFQFYKVGSTIASLPRKCAKPKDAYKVSS